MAETTLVLMGRTGNGKSATGNMIIGRNVFTARWSLKSVTKECKMDSRVWKDGRKINVVDTPGLFDTSASKEFVDKQIVKCIDLAKEGIHGVLLVLSIKNRFTPEEANVYDNLQMLFGPRITDYMVVVFTGGDQLDYDGITLEEYLEEFPPQLKMLLRRCNDRRVLFDNTTTSERKKEKQITKLLQHVDTIIVENENQPYTNELFQKAKEMATQLFYIRDKDNAYAEQAKRLNEMKEQNIRATTKKIQKIKKELGEQLAESDYARREAENEALSTMEEKEEEIRQLEEELEQARKAIEYMTKPKPSKGYCSIL